MRRTIILFTNVLLIFSLCSCQNIDESSQGQVVKQIDFHTKLQLDYLNDEIENISYYANGDKELSKPQGYEISFNNPDGLLYTITLESGDDTRVYNTRNSSFVLNNLLLNKEYHCSIQKGDSLIQEEYFLTSDLAPRNIDVDGITNFRDLGGHKTNSNSLTRQGMLYRSSKFNENGTKDPLITSKGKTTVINELKIKSEVDLRLTSNNETGGITNSPIGPSVKYYSIPMTFDGDVFTQNETEIKNLFDVISIKENYPLVFHCSIGTDRTGLIAMILNSLLDVRVEDLYRDYLFSNFGYIGGSRNHKIITDYINKFSLYGGTTLKENVNNYLLSIGVSQDKINSFISIMN